LTAIAQQSGYLQSVFSGGARTAFQLYTGHVNALLFIKRLGQFGLGHARGQQAPLTANQNRGWVMADINLDTKNTSTFSKHVNDKGAQGSIAAKQLGSDPNYLTPIIGSDPNYSSH
jgi:hypothetical protein